MCGLLINDRVACPVPTVMNRTPALFDVPEAATSSFPRNSAAEMSAAREQHMPNDWVGRTVFRQTTYAPALATSIKPADSQP
jgi:hypothetical protein